MHRIVVAIMTILITASATSQARTDRWTRLERIDLKPDGQPTATAGAVQEAAVSDDGRWVIFRSTASDPVAGDSNDRADVFVRDRKPRTTRRLSLRADGSQTAMDSRSTSASADGRFVGFVSADGQIVAADTNSMPDQFRRDRDSDGNGILDEPGGSSARCVSVGPDGRRMAIGSFAQFDLSRDGRRLAIVASDATGENPHGADVWIRDLATDAVSRIAFVAADSAKGGSCCGNQLPRISRGGDVVAFTSHQLYAFSGISTTYRDVFVKARSRELTRLTDYPVPDAGYSAMVAAMSPGGAYLLISFHGAGATPVAEEGTYVYQRDTIFDSAFEVFWP